MTTRRNFLAGATAAAAFPSISRAFAIPARRRTGTIKDVKHIVILMQENRSFDHYFGTMRGVRGFGDRLHTIGFDPPLMETFAFITRRHGHLSPATREFMRLAEQRLGVQ